MYFQLSQGFNYYVAIMLTLEIMFGSDIAIFNLQRWTTTNSIEPFQHAVCTVDVVRCIELFQHALCPIDGVLVIEPFQHAVCPRGSVRSKYLAMHFSMLCVL